ncbi:MAG: hypothetical protein O2788_05200 [Chloroflexi bacterium]|nr:hypothetical protein [Chloroflexota bacterium]
MQQLPQAKPIAVTRVVIAAPGPLRTVLTSKISGSAEVKLAGAAEISTVEKMVTEEADVAAIDIHLGGELAGLDVARNVQKACPESGILIMVHSLAGVDVRRHSRMFGVSWSYALSKSLTGDAHFGEVVLSVGRGIHWIDPGIKPLVEAIWKVASEGKDMEIANAVQSMEMSVRNAPPPLLDPKPAIKPGGIQTMQSGNSGIGSGFGVRKAS